MPDVNVLFVEEIITYGVKNISLMKSGEFDGKDEHTIEQQKILRVEDFLFLNI